MAIKVGTFNLNNLFSRFDFSADLSTADEPSVTTTTSFRFHDPAGFKLRTYQGKLVKGKPDAERALIAERINEMDLDVLAVQEVEDIDTLRHFVSDELHGRYKYIRPRRRQRPSDDPRRPPIQEAARSGDLMAAHRRPRRPNPGCLLA